jgi:hypothetical protein
MTQLPHVTVVAVTTKDHGPTVVALHKTLEQIQPAKVMLFSDVLYLDNAWQCVIIDRFRSVEDYNRFIFKELGSYIQTSHVLVIQHDGHVINGDAWREDWLTYDYIGAPWTYTDGRNVGNGGFSLRSARLHQILRDDEFEYYSPEDEKICRYYRQTLELKYGVKFAPDYEAHAFSYEMHAPKCKTFGFHNYFHPQYREPIVLKRDHAMGDVIMLEPVMEYFYLRGYRVILDCQPQYYNLFGKHHYQVEHIQNVATTEDASEYRVINFDLAYEIEPKELVLKSYYKVAGITDGVLRNSKLNFPVTPDVKLFDRYVVLHNDDTNMPHRNVYGVDWDAVASRIEKLGYLVLRVGHAGCGGNKINTKYENMLAYIIAGADYFIGVDSGPAQIAVACGVRSMIFFGSVDPALRYPNRENIYVMQDICPVNKRCYHDVIGETGMKCEVNEVMPPCCVFDVGSGTVYDDIDGFITKVMI